MSTIEAATTAADSLRQGFKDVFSQLASGVCVVAFWRDGHLHGFTATSVTSVSLRPPRVLFCVAQSSQSYACLGVGLSVGIAVLSAGQRTLSDRFASKGAPGSYDDVATIEGPGRAPLIAGALGQLGAEIVELIPSGDHAVVLCDVTSALASADGAPLLYHARSYHTLHPTS
ncbi:putative flavin-dependent reductase (fragment) [Bradyrhizobium sp. ORS 375]|uniref:flavin reductase family protein n=1 Tax=Bradyrhizobium sp. (strain ORS 375) TaxID=566679 RepID=UPI0002406E56